MDPNEKAALTLLNQKMELMRLREKIDEMIGDLTEQIGRMCAKRKDLADKMTIKEQG
jgi:hypothetical protein